MNVAFDEFDQPGVAFLFSPEHLASAVIEASQRIGVKAVFDLTGLDPIALLEERRHDLATMDGIELKLSAEALLLDPAIPGFLGELGVTTIWTELLEPLAPDADAVLEKLSELSGAPTIVPILGSVPLIRKTLQTYPEIRVIALKGNEAGGFVGSEPLFILYSAARQMLQELADPPRLTVWGGIALAEAAAAFLATGAKRIVCESVHWLTDLFPASDAFRNKIAKLRVDHTDVAGAGLGTPCRFFNKGSSRAVKEIKDFAGALRGSEITSTRQREFRERIRERWVTPSRASFGRDELIPLGIEAAFAAAFADRYGTRTEAALAEFKKEIDRHLVHAPEAAHAFDNSPAARGLGVLHPFIQGAMTWITDNPQFARRIAEAGGLATIAMGMMDGAAIEEKLGDLPRMMGDYPYAVNVITLDENPYRDVQLEWVKRIKPRFAVIAAGDPSHAVDLPAAGIEPIYIAPNVELLRLAFEQGVRFVICEGNEAGGHVGQYTTLTWAQVLLDWKRREPGLFEGRTVILAGGICNRETAFMAAMLGADAIQMGTAYLAVSDIVETGALSPLYQKMILDASPGSTIVTGEAAGLRVRSLKTRIIDHVCSLERDFAAGKEDETSFRRGMEALSAGSLCIAARGVHPVDGSALGETACIERGQFMSGAAAGVIKKATTARELHAELAGGPLAAGLPFTGPLSRGTSPESGSRTRAGVAASDRWRGKHERVAITGMSIVNSLGSDPRAVWEASLRMQSGVRETPPERWNHALFFHPRLGEPEKTYCKVGAFQSMEIHRQDIGAPPQDFRTMTDSTRMTLWLAAKAVHESGLLESDIPRERIGVVISQNSGEAASTLRDVIIRASTGRIAEAIHRVAPLSPELRAAVEKEIKRGRLAIDDTTLLGRLNSTAGGFICNRFGFMGPSFSVSAACATGLVALYCAWWMIQGGVLDAAVVGGAEEPLTPLHFLEFSALGALAGISGVERAPREASRPFDFSRDGMVLGEGGGMIVLERESVARKRGARVHGYITSMGASNNHLGMVESSQVTQKIAIGASLADLPYDAGSIELVECHATATRQGDVEEVLALRSFFESSGRTVLASFKSQIGHTLGASGINSLIRGVMAMQDGVFPPTLNFTRPDPQMGLDGSDLAILPEPQAWRRANGGPRRMEVNAFGFGGSNYVVQLEQAMDGEGSVLVNPSPPGAQPDAGRPNLPEQLFFFRTEASGLSYRLAVEADSDASAVELVKKAEPIGDDGRISPKRLKALARQGIHLGEEQPPPKLALVFPGQGAHYAGMGHELYRTFPLIREWMDRAASVAEFDLLRLLFHDREEDLQKTRWQQPALFTMEYAMARYLWALGARPTALAGHSLGELTALCLAGVYSFEDGFRIVNKRAIYMDKACTMNSDPGVMMAVNAPLEVVQNALAGRPDVHLTNINSPRQLVVGGNTEAVKLLGDALKSNGYRITLLPVSMAFHSPIMRCIHDELEAFLADIPFHAPRIPVISNTMKEPFPDDPREIKRIVMAHLESPVQWMSNVLTLWNDFGIRLFVEVGPREILSHLIADTIGEAECITTCLPSAEVSVLKTAVARLYVRNGLSLPKPVRAVSLVRPQEPGDPFGRRGAKAAAGAGAEPALRQPDPLEAIVQKQINAFVIESFGRFLKPAILAAIRVEHDPAFTERNLETVLHRLFPGLGNSPPEPPAVEEQSQSAGIVEGAAGYDRRETDAVTETVIRMIMEVTGYEREEIEPGMNLREDLAIRSSRLPVILDGLEGRFGIKIKLEDFRDVRTIRELVEKIVEVQAREKPGKESQARTRGAPATGTASKPGETEAKPPIKRVVFKNIALERADMEPVEISPMASVVVLSSGRDPDISTQAGDVIRRDYGCNMVPMTFLAEVPDAERGAFDLRFTDSAGAAAAFLRDVESLAGLAIVFDHALEAGMRSMEDASRALEGFFCLIKTFLESPDGKFVALVDLSGARRGAAGSVLREGLLGLFLSASHERGGVLFRSVSAGEDAEIRNVIRGALDRSWQYTGIAMEGDRVLTLGGEAAPVVFSDQSGLSLGPDDVILLSGGCSGIMVYLARSFVPYGCKVAFVGRTSPPADRRDSGNVEEAADGAARNLERSREIFPTLDKLRKEGIHAEYFQCDVTDPESVSSAVHAIEERLGKITGIVHGAGGLRDGFIRDMTAEDFSTVVRVKLIGAWRLFEQTRAALKFFTGLSSAACIQGNPGQANYAGANRAMSGLIAYWNTLYPGILFKAFMLPPIEGAGMAENPDVRAVMRLMNAGYVHVEELSRLFSRELFLGAPEEVWVLFMRSLPEVRTAYLKTGHAAYDPDLEANGMLFDAGAFPLIDRITSINLQTAELVAERTFDGERDPWLADHKPFKFMKHPLVSAIMGLELLIEACRMLHPDLKVKGVREARFLDMIECLPALPRRVQVHCRTSAWTAEAVVCEASLAAEGISPAGRPVERMHPGCGGFVLLAGMVGPLAEPADCPVRMDELDTRSIDHEEMIRWYAERSDLHNRYRVIDILDGTAPGAVRGRMIYRETIDFQPPRLTVYQYSPYVLEALFQIVGFYVSMRDEAEKRGMIPLSIGELLFGRKCADGEEVTLVARMVGQDDRGITWNARATSRDGEPLMIVNQLKMGWF
ncbi:MAG: SDR family NAD(P)-dependent oxidoreductase [Pseudomonadota bacterium]